MTDADLIKLLERAIEVIAELDHRLGAWIDIADAEDMRAEDDAARDAGDIAIRLANAAINEIQRRADDEIAVRWSYEDVLMRADANEIPITADEARDLLRTIARRHDATIGINWDVIDVNLEDEYGERRSV